MKKLNKKGFTLIELLAVIVIMGILMMVAIPAMQTYINNSKKDTYISTVKEVVNAVRNADSAGYLGPVLTTGALTDCTSGTYYVQFNTGDGKILESGGKSPFDKSKAIKGYIKIQVDAAGKHTYSVKATDDAKNGVGGYVDVDTLTRGILSDSTSDFSNFNAPSSSIVCEIKN